MGFAERWKGKAMLTKAARACTGALCWAWSTKYRWQDSYLGYHSKMSNCACISTRLPIDFAYLFYMRVIGALRWRGG